MFDFLQLFSNGASILSTGASLFNTYAGLQANKERTKQALYEQQHLLKQQQEHARFDGQQLLERTAEYSAISSYHVDMLRQKQMHDRQELGYNILKSGIGITATDSAGLLLRHQAYIDEMHARSIEAKLFHERPRSSFNKNIMELNTQGIKHNISSIKSASPWQTLGTLVGGVRDLASIARMGEE
jgi:hypothetical protein